MIVVNVRKRYAERTVLDVSDLRLAEGGVYLLLGSNGSGKSTLLKAVGGMIGFEGKVSLGADKPSIGYMPQKDFSFSLSVRRNLTIGLKGMSRAEKRAAADAMLDRLGLTELAKKNAARLSGGETERLSLGRVLMRPHGVLLLDEPTSAMDVNSALRCEGILKHYIEEYKPTVLMTTHSLQQAKRMGGEVLFLHEGRLAERADTRRFFDAPISREARDYLRLFS